jgi:tetratricopeptide (TPR) repeat protein
MPSISYNLIVRNNPEGLERALTSLYEVLWEEGDETIVVDTGSDKEALRATQEVCKAFTTCDLILRPDLMLNDTSKAKEWLGKHYDLLGDGRVLRSFAEAREVAREASVNPVIFWIDTDDTLVEQPEQHGALRRLINDVMNPEAPKVSAVYLDYAYAHSKDGTCTTVLRRERAVFKDWFEWKGNCHETLIPIEGTPARSLPQGFFEGVPAYVHHHKINEDNDQLKASDARNYIILRNELERDCEAGTYQDPRTLFYFGNATRGLHRFHEAIDIYKDFIGKSGSQDDRFASCYYIAGIYMLEEFQRPWDAIEWYKKCIDINPRDPRAWYGLSRAYAYMQRWADAMLYYEHGETLPEPQGLHSYDPTHVHFHPHVVAAHCCRKLEKYDRALKYIKKAAANRPNDKDIQDSVNLMQNEANGHGLHKAVETILGCLKFGGPPAMDLARNIAGKLAAVPPSLEKKGIGAVEPPDPRKNGPSLAIWCGGSNENWDYTSEDSGCGGSEKMVILIADALQKRGVNVSVYAEVPFQNRGISPAGVAWHHWSQFDQKRQRDVLVVWRNHAAVHKLISPSKIRVLWNHDVQNPAAYCDSLRAAVDHVQFQSEYHTEPVEGVLPDAKRWVARNAIDAERFTDEEIEKNPKVVAFLSSPDRGLLTAAKIVERAQKIDPEIQLVALYGFTPWARKAYAGNQHMHIPDIGRDGSIDEYEKELMAQLDKVGATFLGRVGWKQVSRLLKVAGAWLYPTRFPEISCMAAMECQAHGVLPVATCYGALEETIFEQSYVLDPVNESEAWMDHAAERLVSACALPGDDPTREDMAKKAIKKYNIDDLAENWISRLGLQEALVAASQEGNGERAAPESALKDALAEIGGFGRGEQYATGSD